MNKITDEMINEIMTPQYTETSEIPILNLIGQAGENKGYVVLYWKWRRPSMFADFDDYDNWKDVYYVHVREDDKIKISVYYDEHGAMAYFGQPYYELYDGIDIERFIVSDEDEIALFDKAKSYL